jgi:glc operon protein GlcG
MCRIFQRTASGAALLTLLFSIGAQAQPSTTGGSGSAAPVRGFNQNYGAPINITQAKAVAAAAVAEAQKRNVSSTLTLAIVNTGGDIVYVQRGLAANVAAMDIALAKARSSSFYGVSTRGFYQALKQNDFKDSLTLPMAASMGLGGLPIIVNGSIIGAIGVAGGIR